MDDFLTELSRNQMENLWISSIDSATTSPYQFKYSESRQQKTTKSEEKDRIKGAASETVYMIANYFEHAQALFWKCFWNFCWAHKLCQRNFLRTKSFLWKTLYKNKKGNLWIICKDSTRNWRVLRENVKSSENWYIFLSPTGCHRVSHRQAMKSIIDGSFQSSIDSCFRFKTFNQQ